MVAEQSWSSSIKTQEAQKNMVHLHEQLTEEFHCDDPLFYDDWLVEVNAVADEWGTEVNEYLQSRIKDHLPVILSKMLYHDLQKSYD